MWSHDCRSIGFPTLQLLFASRAVFILMISCGLAPVSHAISWPSESNPSQCPIWPCNGHFDSGDFVATFQDSRYEQGRRDDQGTNGSHDLGRLSRINPPRSQKYHKSHRSQRTTRTKMHLSRKRLRRRRQVKRLPKRLPKKGSCQRENSQDSRS